MRPGEARGRLGGGCEPQDPGRPPGLLPRAPTETSCGVPEGTGPWWPVPVGWWQFLCGYCGPLEGHSSLA